MFLLCRKGVWWPGDRHVSEIRLAGRLRRSSGRSTAPVQPPCVPHLVRAGQSSGAPVRPLYPGWRAAELGRSAYVVSLPCCTGCRTRL